MRRRFALSRFLWRTISLYSRDLGLWFTECYVASGFSGEGMSRIMHRVGLGIRKGVSVGITI